MYRVKSIVLLGLALLLFAGCFVPALNPPYLETDLIEDDRIIGTWVGKDGKNSGKWIFTKETGRTYSLLIADEEATDRLTAHLFSLDGETYLDLYPGKLRTEDLGTITAFLLIPAHMFCRLSIADDTLGISFLDFAWFRDLVNENRTDLEYAAYDKNMFLITADTANLRQFIMIHKEEAFSEPIVLVRTEEAGP